MLNTISYADLEFIFSARLDWKGKNINENNKKKPSQKPTTSNISQII